jgi:hypothetical protein
MATIAGQGTTYNLPNYHGELFTVTPTDTPFLSAIGGLAGAKTTKATQFEWQTVDRRASVINNVALEGAALPAAAERSRVNVDNVVEIHQSAIEVSYTKLAATGQFSGANIGPQSDDPTINELAIQSMAELQSMAVDIERSFLNGVYQKPSDNTTARKTRGLLSAIVTNVLQEAGASVGTGTIVASTGVFTASGTTSFTVGQAIDLGAVTTTTGVSAGRYYVLTTPSGTTFTLSATPGGPPLTLTTNGTVASISPATAVTKAMLDSVLQLAYSNGAQLSMDSTVILVGPYQKVSLSNVYTTPNLNQPTMTRNIGGVALETLVTDFGVFGVMLDRWMPNGTIAVVDLSVCAPVFLEIPDKGLLFTEEMPQLGAARRFQLYGEIGLEYGPETYHAMLQGVA